MCNQSRRLRNVQCSSLASVLLSLLMGRISGWMVAVLVSSVCWGQQMFILMPWRHSIGCIVATECTPSEHRCQRACKHKLDVQPHTLTIPPLPFNTHKIGCAPFSILRYSQYYAYIARMQKQHAYASSLVVKSLRQQRATYFQWAATVPQSRQRAVGGGGGGGGGC